MEPRLKSIGDLDTLETDRLIVKPLSKEFLSEVYVGWMNDKKVNRYLQSGGDYTLQKLARYIDDVENKPKYFWAITLKSNGKHIGNIKIDPVNFRNKFGEYGIMVGDRHEWGKGYANEASKAVIKFCFDSLKLNKINLGVLISNKAAIRLYQKLGFRIEGHLKKHEIHNRHFVDTYRMAIFNLVDK